MTSSQIIDNLHSIQTQIEASAQQAGRSVNEIRLIAVSKRHPISLIEEAFGAGQRDFGENRVQEALNKIETLQETPIEWHLIGNLQKNKAKFCPGKFQWIHSLDSVALVEKLEAKCIELDVSLNGLVQVNIFEEDSKSGVTTWDDLNQIAETLSQCQKIQWKGLMTIGDPRLDEVGTRQGFAKLRGWLIRLQTEWQLPDLKELSMGMSSDFTWAIQEGATMLRIGTSIFGTRQP